MVPWGRPMWSWAITKMSFHRRAPRGGFPSSAGEDGPAPRAICSLALWKKTRRSRKCRRDALAVDQHVLLVEVPAAGADLQGGDLSLSLYSLPFFVAEEFAADGLA